VNKPSGREDALKGQRLACRLVALLGIGARVLAMPALAQDSPELVGLFPRWAVVPEWQP
jgi:hypothetical protein